jgi:uncharacterized protein (DUF924 family)
LWHQWLPHLSKKFAEGAGLKAAIEVLEFWFEQSTPKQWFAKDLTFDTTIKQRFDSRVQQALNHELLDWAQEPETGLALILLLDQFTRHIYRDDPRAFAGDVQALALAQRAVDQGWVAGNADLSHRRFYLMPMMHSEDLVVQRDSILLFATHTDQNTLSFAQRHLAIIERFGRFPHRNQVLSRQSTAQERAFLEQPGSSF